MSPYRPINVPYWGAMVDYNIFTDETIQEAAIANNTDTHSIVYPVSFINPAKGDYRIKNDCKEVFQIGFQNFPMNRFGVVSPRLKNIAKTPQMSLPIISSENKSNMVLWHGWQIKNMETLGERSATGMDSERGVYVVSSAKFNNPLRDFIQANDVILKLDGKPVNALDDLLKAEKQLDLTKEVELIIFRNQKENVIVVPGNTFK